MLLTSETATFSSSKEELSAFYACPEGTGPFSGVVVIHEIFGLNSNIKGIAERFAAEGYAALAVDLFSGRNRALCMARFMSGMLLNSLDHGGIHDLKAALDFLSARPEVDSGRVGAIGFCMGGGFAVAWACTDDRLKVVAPFYGANPRPLEAVKRVCPVVGSYPEKDFTKGQAEKLGDALQKYGVPHDIKVYPDTRHSFFNAEGRTYDAAASEGAWRRTLAFFELRLS